MWKIVFLLLKLVICINATSGLSILCLELWNVCIFHDFHPREAKIRLISISAWIFLCLSSFPCRNNAEGWVFVLFSRENGYTCLMKLCFLLLCIHEKVLGHFKMAYAFCKRVVAAQKRDGIWFWSVLLDFTGKRVNWFQWNFFLCSVFKAKSGHTNLLTLLTVPIPFTTQQSSSTSKQYPNYHPIYCTIFY